MHTVKCNNVVMQGQAGMSWRKQMVEGGFQNWSPKRIVRVEIREWGGVGGYKTGGAPLGQIKLLRQNDLPP